MCLSIFPFDVWEKLWVLIRSVPEVSLLIKFAGFLDIISTKPFVLIGTSLNLQVPRTAIKSQPSSNFMERRSCLMSGLTMIFCCRALYVVQLLLYEISSLRFGV